MSCHQQHLPFVKHLAERDGWHEWPACSFDIPIPIQPSRASRLVREASLPLLTQPHQVAAAAPNTHQSQQPLVAQGPSLLCGEWRILLFLSPMHAWLQVVAGAWVGGSVALGGHIPPPTSLPSSPFPSSLLGVHLSFVMGSNDAADPPPMRCQPLHVDANDALLLEPPSSKALRCGSGPKLLQVVVQIVHQFHPCATAAGSENRGGEGKFLLVCRVG